MHHFYINDSLISEVYEIYLDKNGVEPTQQIKDYILDKVEIDRTSLDILIGGFHASTRLAIDQIHRAFRGNPKITREEAQENMRRSMFFLNEKTFQRFFQWADWCVAKGA